MVIITVGKICSGKSTWAKNQNNYLILSIDEVILSLFDNCLEDNHQKTVLKIEKYFLDKIVILDKLGINVILDDGFYQVSRRKEVINFLNKNNIDFKIKYFELSTEERIKRLILRNEENKKSRKREFILSVEKMYQIDSKFENINDEEKKYLIN